MKSQIPQSLVVEVCARSNSMAKAAAELNIHFNTLKRLAILYNCYRPNQGLKGGNKNAPAKIILNKILAGEHPSFQTYKLKNRLLKEGILIYKCAICGINSCNNKQLSLELDHIDGNRVNHTLPNLRLLCPNCHAQTDTYRSKNRFSNE
jgi:5-methylcytosine-specific restriction endonuclease McrA